MALGLPVQYPRAKNGSWGPSNPPTSGGGPTPRGGVGAPSGGTGSGGGGGGGGSTIQDPNGNIVPAPVLPGPTPLPDAALGTQRGLDFFTGLYGPELELLRQQQEQLAGQLGYLGAYDQTQRGLLQQRYGLDSAQLGNQQAGIGLQRELLGISGRELDLDLAGLGITRGGLNRQLGYYDQLESLANLLLGNQGQGFQLARVSAMEGADRDLRSANSSATARGAWNAPGIGRTRTDIGEILAGQLGNIDVDQRAAELNRMREQAGLENQRGQTRDELGRVGLDEQRIGLNRERLDVQNRELDLRANQLGIQQDQLRNSLDQGLANLGIDTFMSTQDLLDKLTSSNLQERTTAEQIYRNALDYSDFFVNYNPAAPASTPAPTGRSGGTPSRSRPPR